MKFRNQKGVTLVTLVTAVIVALILAGIATTAGKSTLEYAKFNKLKNELTTLQTKVNELNQEGKTNIGQKIGNAQKEILNTDIVSNIIYKNRTDEEKSSIENGFRFLSSTEIEKQLGLEDFNRNYLINVEYRYVVATEGLEYEGTTYYMIDQIEDGMYNVEYHNKNSDTGSFDVSTKVEGDICKIVVSNIQHEGYVSNWQVKYKLDSDETWKTSNSLEFEIDTAGNYIVNVVHESEIDLGKKSIYVNPNIIVGNVYINSNGESSWNVNIEEIKYPQDATNGKIEYRKSDSDSWNSVQDSKFTVQEAGVYYIRITDSNGNTNVVNASGEKYKNGEIPVYIYVKNGLTLALDATQNTRSGRQSNTTVWEDLSGNNLDATLENFDMTSESGWTNNSLHFDGKNDKGIIKNNSLLKVNDQTIEVVIKKDSVINNDRSIFFVKWYGFTMEFNADNTVTYGRNNGYLKAANKIELKKIYSIVGTHSNNTSTIYLNNVNNGTQSVTPISYDNNDLTIGYYNDTYLLNGDIYQIRMYNRKLTDEEIKTNYEIDNLRYQIN